MNVIVLMAYALATLSAYAAALGLFAATLFALSASISERCYASASCRTFLLPARALPNGWYVDLADHQWRAFQSRLSLLIPLAACHAAGGSLVRRYCKNRRHAACVAYDGIAGVVLVIYIHRAQ